MRTTLRYSFLAAMAFALLAGCSGGGGNGAFFAPSQTSALIATGGTGSAGNGGAGGGVLAQSSGALTVLNSGGVDAGFVVSEPTPSFGQVHAVVTGGTTTVLADADTEPGNLCIVSGSVDGAMYIGDGSGTCGDGGDQVVTGVTVDAGATMVLPEFTAVPGWVGYGLIKVSNDVVVNGTIISTATMGFGIEANMLVIGKRGRISASATDPDTNAKEIWIGWDSTASYTRSIFNHGTIEANGMGSGTGGYVWLEALDYIVHDGNLDILGGSSDTGSGGGDYYMGSQEDLDIFVDYGNFYSSGSVRLNGGRGGGGAGGNAGYAWIETAYSGNDNGLHGDIILSGTWEAIGGDGVNGDGGGLGYMRFQTDAMGAIAVNATMRVRGGAGASGGTPQGIDFYSYNNTDHLDVAEPGRVRIAGTFDLQGGAGALNGGSAGYLNVFTLGANSSFKGCDVEFLNFPTFILNGGDGVNGGPASFRSVDLYTYTPQYPNADSGSGNTNSVPSGAITNKAGIQARGGNASAGGTGGAGGYVEMITGWNMGPTPYQDATTMITNSGTISLSGGTGDTGGSTYGPSIGGGYSLYFDAYHVKITGKLMVNGGNGATTGGDGGDIYIMSGGGTPSTANQANMSVAGGKGGTTNGKTGTISID